MRKKAAQRRTGIKIAFISPAPTVLKHDWYRDLLWQKVGVPNLAGFLKRAGFPCVTQYDFNNQVRAAYAACPSRVKLLTYADEAAVAAFLRGAPGPAAAGVKRQTAFFLDALGVKEHDLFAITLNNFLGDDREIALGARLGECLAKELKTRFPGARVMAGGMQNMSVAFQRESYKKMMKECRYIDYVVCGEGHKATLEICRAVQEGRRFTAVPGLDAVTIRRGLLIQSTGSVAASLARYFARGPEGEAKDTSVPFGYPAYDAENSRAYSYTGRQVRDFYHLPEKLAAAEKCFTTDNYLTLHVSFSEGCNFNCLFCSNARTGVFALSIDESVRILRKLRDELGCSHFLFYNPNFNPTMKYARAFLERIIKEKLDIRWADCFNLRNMDAELIAMMREAGVVKIVTGVEYPTPRMLKYINKGITVDRINRNLELLDKAGIWNHVLLITGMPTETEADVREMEGWLSDTKDLVNAYTVGSFHMADGSPFQKDPEKFGFNLKDAMKLYCQTEYDEKDGLAWREKQRQNAENNGRIRAFIDDLKGSRKPTATRMDDSHLLMYLYRTLGHGRKREIERLYEAAYTVNPHVAAAHAHLRREAGLKSSGLSRLLDANGARLRLGRPTHESFSLALEKGAAALSFSAIARNEDTLINPAAGLLHGNYFMLEADKAAGGGLKERLSALVAGLGARLTSEGSRGGKFFLLLVSGRGRVRFTINPSGRAPSYTIEVVSGTEDRAVLENIGGLLLASATGNSPDRAWKGLNRLLPAILKTAESWR